MSALVLGTSVSLAATTEDKVVTSNMVSYGNPIIFVENGITFSVYPDGEFDFYIDDRVNVGANVNFGNTSITFNSGYNYDPYVQYDDYGAVIQVENIPVYYDYYGRVSQIGDVNIWYRNGRVHRVGGLYVYYNPRGVFTHYTGYVNIYNRHYVYRQWHGYFVRPAVGFCLVYNRPYRRYYTPVRYTYYRPYAYNSRKSYARIGHHYEYGRSPKREHIYRNDKRVVAHDHSTRRSQDIRSNRNVPVRRDAVAADRRSVTRNNTDYNRKAVTRSNSQKAHTSERSGNNERSNAVANRTAQRDQSRATSKPQQLTRERSVTQRTVTRNTGNKTATRSTAVNKRSGSDAGRTVKTSSRSERSTANRTAVKRSVNKAPSRVAHSSQGAKERSKSRRVH
jgi:hypothetical protein